MLGDMFIDKCNKTRLLDWLCSNPLEEIINRPTIKLPSHAPSTCMGRPSLIDGVEREGKVGLERGGRRDRMSQKPNPNIRISTILYTVFQKTSP